MQEHTNIKNKVFSNFMWRFAERCGAQLVAFIVTIILARILNPEAYGTIELVMVFITILQVFVDSGLGNALIQKKDADNIDFSTVFFVNILLCIILYFIVFIVAPYIAVFYGNVSLTSVIRVLSLTIVIAGVRNVQQAYVAKNMLFRKFFFSTIGGTILAAFVGIAMALQGYGVWALVAQQILNAAIGTIILWFTVKWRPQFCFSIERLRGLFSYGWKLLASSLLDTIYNNVSQLIIGKRYSSSDLAYYNRGNKFPNIIITNVNTSIDSVLLPAMSSKQDVKEAVKNMTRRSIKTSIYIIAPLMMGLAFTASNVVMVLLTEKWMECVPYMIIFCINYMFWPIHTANLNAIKAMGKSDIFLKLEVLKKIIGMVLLLSSMWFGVMAMACSLVVGSVLSQIINSWPNKKLLGYSYIEQLKDIVPSILMAIVMGICIKFVPTIGDSSLLTLTIQIILGAGIYIVESIITKNESFCYIIDCIIKITNRNRSFD